MTPLPRSFSELQPNVLIARCVQCRRLAFASELCMTLAAIDNCPRMTENLLAANYAAKGQEAPLVSPAA